MEKFNTDPRIFIFILSTRSGGVGINLVGADTVIFYDTDWNPAMDLQAQDRCHRIGQTRVVNIYRLVSENTVEENILKKSMQKREMNEVVIGDGQFTTDFFQAIDPRELLGIDAPLQLPENELLSASTSGSKNKNRSRKEQESAMALVEDEDDQTAAQQLLEEQREETDEFSLKAKAAPLPLLASTATLGAVAEADEKAGKGAKGRPPLFGKDVEGGAAPKKGRPRKHAEAGGADDDDLGIGLEQGQGVKGSMFVRADFEDSLTAIQKYALAFSEVVRSEGFFL